MSVFQPIREICQRQPVMVLFLAFGLFFIGQLLVQLVSAILGLVLAGDALAVSNLAGAEPEAVLASRNLFRSAHISGQLLGWGFAAWAGGLILGSPRQELALDRSPGLWGWLLAPVVMLLAAPLAQAIYIDRSWEGFPGMESIVASARDLEVRAEATSRAILGIRSLPDLLFNLLTFALAPAVCEELFFRGLIQRNLARAFRPWLAILLTAIIFSLLHFMLFGFFARMLMGLVLGTLAWYGKSIWPAILAHFTFNTVTVLSFYFGQNESSESLAWWVIALAAGLSLAAGWLYIKKTAPVAPPSAS